MEASEADDVEKDKKGVLTSERIGGSITRLSQTTALFNSQKAFWDGSRREKL